MKRILAVSLVAILAALFLTAYTRRSSPLPEVTELGDELSDEEEAQLFEARVARAIPPSFDPQT